MKKIYILIYLSIIISFSNAQTPDGTIAPPGFTGNCAVLHNSFDFDHYIFGTDGDTIPESVTYGKAQQFSVATPYTIYGAVLWVGAKTIIAGDTLVFRVWDMDGMAGQTSTSGGLFDQPSPNTTLVYEIVPMVDVVVSNQLDNAQVIMFSSPLTVTSDYALGISLGPLRDDLIGIYALNYGETGGAERAWELIPFGWQTIKSKWWHPVAGALDADMLIFPIIDVAAYNVGANTNVQGCLGTGINKQEDVFNGMRLSSPYPNPSTVKSTIQYEIEEAGDVSLSVYDLQGKRVIYIDEGHKSAGGYSLNIDIADLGAGDYIFLLISNNRHLAKKMNIVK